MEFQTKIVEGNKNPKARIVWAGGGLFFLAMILTCIHGYERYGLWLFGVAVVLMIGGALLVKGNFTFIDVSTTDIVIGTTGVRVGDTTYPLSQLTDIEFLVEGYDGMSDSYGYVPITRRNYSTTRGRVNGMNNYLTFKLGDEKVEWQFYLPDPQHVQQLGALFEELYSKHIPFVERSPTSDRTFLFEPVSESQLEDRMIQNGYL